MTMTTSLLDVQRAIYVALTGDSGVMAVVTVYDEIPENAPFPYLVIGDHSETISDTFGRQGRDLILMLHIWSQAHGYKESLTIAENVIRVLNRQPLPLAHGTMAYIWYIGAPLLMRDPDGLSRHVVIKFETYVQE